MLHTALGNNLKNNKTNFSNQTAIRFVPETSPKTTKLPAGVIIQKAIKN